MIVVVIVIHLILVLAMIAVILLQKSEGGGLVSSTSGFMTGRGTANVLTRTTAILAFFFFITSLFLSWLASYDRKPSSIINPASQSQPAGGATPIAPPTSGGGILDSLKKSDEQQQNQPAPSGPQAPRSQ